MQVEDPWTSQVLKYTEMGFSREEVCMALAALGTDADKDNEVCFLMKWMFFSCLVSMLRPLS